MAMGDFFYPPILSSSQPAYDYNDNLIVINFDIPSMLQTSQIKHIGVTLVKQSNGKSVVNTIDQILYYNYTGENKVYINKKDLTADYTADNLYKVQLRFGSEEYIGDYYKQVNIYYNRVMYYIDRGEMALAQDVANLSGLSKYPEFDESQYYPYVDEEGKVYSTIQLPTEKERNAFTNWKTDQVINNNFSDWSAVMVIKPIVVPTISFQRVENSSINDLDNIVYLENTLTPEFIGNCIWEKITTEYEDSYRFVLIEDKKDGKIIEDTGWLTHNINMGYDKFISNTILTNGEYYSITYSIKTNNGYVTSAIKYDFQISLVLDEALKTFSFYAVGDTAECKEKGIIQLYLDPKEKVEGNFVLTRSSNLSNYTEWEDLGFLSQTLFEEKTLIYSDYTVESGIQYKYAIAREDRSLDGKYSRRTSPLFLNNTTSIQDCPSVEVNFEYAFLYASGKQLKLKFNNKMSSFKKTILASKSDTIGSRYPTILRNGHAYYAEFPITGLITLQMDDNQDFFTLGEDGYYYNDELIIPKNKFNNRNVRESTNTNEVYSSWTSTDLVDDNIFIERKFREKVEEFLNNGDNKLYRSPTEGNFVVNLLNISFTPNQTLGRMIYEFNSTAYEVADKSIKSLINNKILEKYNYNDSDKTITEEKLGNTILTTNLSSNTDIIAYIRNQFNGTTNKLVSINRIELEAVDKTSGYITFDLNEQMVVFNKNTPYIIEPADSINSLKNWSENLNINYTITVKIKNQEQPFKLQSYLFTMWGQHDTRYLTTKAYRESLRRTALALFGVEYYSSEFGTDEKGKPWSIFNHTNQTGHPYGNAYTYNNKKYICTIVSVYYIDAELDENSVINEEKDKESGEIIDPGIIIGDSEIYFIESTTKSEDLGSLLADRSTVYLTTYKTLVRLEVEEVL